MSKCYLRESQTVAKTEAQQENVVSSETVESQTDFYQILGLEEDSSLQTIKRKWLKLSLIYHPDKCDGDDDMFRKINLAYKVLSNPENRKKYDESLGKTYDQLKDVGQRDTKYHVNPEFIQLKEGIIAKPIFNRDKFLNEFENNRRHFEHLNEIEVVNEARAREMPKKDIDQLMAERDAELTNIQDQQEQLRDATFDPRSEGEQFHFIFNQFKRMTGTELEEAELDNSPFNQKIEPTSQLEFSALNQNDYLNIDQQKQMLQNLTSNYQEQFLDQGVVPIVRINQSTPQSKLDELVIQRKLETEMIAENFEASAENTLVNPDNILLTQELSQISQTEEIVGQ